MIPAYQELEPVELATMLAAENQGVTEDLTIENLPRLFAPQRRVFPDYLKGKVGSMICYKITAETLGAFDDFGSNFNESAEWVARAVILHGLALEMEKERYVPAPFTACPVL